MDLWELGHSVFFITRNLHFFELLALILVAVMVIIAVVHHILQRRREKIFEESLRSNSGAPSTNEKGDTK